MNDGVTIDRWMNRMDESDELDGWMDEWREGWMDSWMDGKHDGWSDG